MRGSDKLEEHQALKQEQKVQGTGPAGQWIYCTNKQKAHQAGNRYPWRNGE